MRRPVPVRGRPIQSRSRAPGAPAELACGSERGRERDVAVVEIAVYRERGERRALVDEERRLSSRARSVAVSNHDSSPSTRPSTRLIPARLSCAASRSRPSDVSVGSPNPFRKMLPTQVVPFCWPRPSTSVRKRYASPRSCSAASVTVSFSLDAGASEVSGFRAKSVCPVVRSIATAPDVAAASPGTASAWARRSESGRGIALARREREDGEQADDAQPAHLDHCEQRV